MMHRHEPPSQCNVTMQRHNGLSQCRVTIIRTDGRTNGEQWFRDGKSFTAVTRGRASRIS